MGPNPLLLTTCRFLRVMESLSGIYLVIFAQTQMIKSFKWTMYISSQISHCQQCKSTFSIPIELGSLHFEHFANKYINHSSVRLSSWRDSVRLSIDYNEGCHDKRNMVAYLNEIAKIMLVMTD